MGKRTCFSAEEGGTDDEYTQQAHAGTQRKSRCLLTAFKGRWEQARCSNVGYPSVTMSRFALGGRWKRWALEA